MLVLKGMLFGVGLSLVGTIIYLAALVWGIVHRAAVPSGSVGIEMSSLVRSSLIHNPAYWLLLTGLLASGFAVVLLWQHV
jgi:hypothetical protein